MRHYDLADAPQRISGFYSIRVRSLGQQDPPVFCQAGMSAYSGSSYDRWAYEQSAPGANDTALNKLQHKYWVAKQGGEKEIDAMLLRQ